MLYTEPLEALPTQAHMPGAPGPLAKMDAFRYSQVATLHRQL